jgi:lactoylglutathione lyase
MAAFNSLGHVAFRVNDLDASLAFYAKLGFPEFLRLTQDDGRPWIAYLKVTDELYLELFPGGDGGKAVGPEHTGVHHLCLTTDDIEATAAHLETVGIPATHALIPTKRGVDGNRGMWVTDPDGNRIEIMEMAAGCVQYEALRAVKRGEPAHSLKRPI